MREKEKATQVIFVRHGQTDFPVDRIYCDGKEEPPLNQLGMAQAAQAATCLQKVEIAAIYASPCRRTQMTAEAIAAHHKHCQINTDPALMERHFGVWEGLYFSEIESRFPEEYKAWKRNQAAFKPDSGESVYDLADRAEPAVKSMIDKHAGKCIVVVSHVGPIRALIASALGLPLAHYRQLRIDPASMSRVDYGKTQNNLIYLNFHGRHWQDGET